LRTVIVANGQYNVSFTAQPQDLIIAADGGAHHCLQHGIQPHTVIGDLDSLTANDLNKLEAIGARVISYPTRKDYTDLELALEYAIQQKPSEILILGGLGGRWDQTIANILLAATQSATKVHLVDADQEFHFLKSTKTIEIHGSPGDIVSLIPLGGDAIGISTQGLEYPLKQETLHFGSTRGISNVLLDPPANVSLEEGLLLCTIDHSGGKYSNVK
jgi:thiamine pyrophosphokinase